MNKTQIEVTADAVKRGIKPEALCLTVTGDVVQVTSWPFLDDEGTARIMVRTLIDDPMSNIEYLYNALSHVIGMRPLQPPFNDGTDPDKPVPENLGGLLS